MSPPQRTVAPEREQRYGYWEMALTARFPDKDVQFRNLGWSGDTVWGQARASFGTPADGFKQLKDHVAALKLRRYRFNNFLGISHLARWLA